MAISNALRDREYESYVDVGIVDKFLKIVTSVNAGSVTSITVPDTAKGFRIYPSGADIQFAINGSPVSIGSEIGQTIPAGSLLTGQIAKADQWETRLLNGFGDTGSRIVTVKADTVSSVFWFEVF